MFILEPDPQQADRSQRARTLRPAGPAADAGQSEQSSPGSAQRNEEEAGRVRLQGLNGEEAEKENKLKSWQRVKGEEQGFPLPT